VTFSDKIDDEDVALLEFDGSFEYYLRVKVWAQPKRKAANRAQGILLKVVRPKEAGDTSTRKVPDGVFHWAGTSTIEHLDIAPGTWRRLDILRYRCERGSKNPILIPVLNSPGYTAYTAQWPPSMRNHLTDAGIYTIDFVVSCDEAVPTFWRLTFRFKPGSAESAADLESHLKNLEVRILH
jgi:hypothetical protein